MDNFLAVHGAGIRHGDGDVEVVASTDGGRRKRKAGTVRILSSVVMRVFSRSATH